MMRSTGHCVLLVTPDRVEARVFTATRFWSKPSLLVATHGVSCSGHGDIEAAVAACLAAVAPLPKRVSVIVSDALCRVLAANRPAGTGSAVELNASLEARFYKAFGENPGEWALSCDTQPRAPVDVVCAIPLALREGVNAAVRAAGARVSSMRPLWVWCAMSSDITARSGMRWLVVADGHAITTGLFDGRVCRGIRTTRSHATDEPLHEVIARQSLLFDRAGEATVVDVWGKGVSAARHGTDSIQVNLNGWPEIWQADGMALPGKAQS